MIAAELPARPRAAGAEEVAAALVPAPRAPGGVASSGGRELPEGLVAAAVRGGARALEELLALIHPLVLQYCRTKLGRQESVLCSADDVAQDVCAAVVGALRTYRLQGLSFRGFVYGIAAHKVTDAFRAMGRDRTEAVAVLPEAPVLADGPEECVLDAERCAQLGVLLAHLTTRQREVLVLRVAGGVSAEETARATGSTPGAVRVTQHRALLRLRRIVLDGDPGLVAVPSPPA
jgi:RNA polymerase sigma-70 factor (ECF subfamily)